eukprot:SAG31_NODE_153_length_22196_cov_24.963570_12_plen_194_part_00
MCERCAESYSALVCHWFVSLQSRSGMTKEEKFTYDLCVSSRSAIVFHLMKNPTCFHVHTVMDRFDLAGFFVRPSILTAAETALLRDQVYLITHDKDALPPHERRVPGRAASLLIDHPKVIEVLQELYGGPDSMRLEHAQAFWRERGERERPGSDGLSQGWHQGVHEGYVNLCCCLCWVNYGRARWYCTRRARS